MRKNYLSVGLILFAASLLPLQSCIGSFSLTNKVLTWNNQVGSKFLNELVFFAFWILPVYEVTAAADLLVINSIEFWSGSSPVEAYEKTLETKEGKYLIACDKTGYKITSPDGKITTILFDEDENTWSLESETGEIIPFMTFVDDTHVNMIMPGGEFRVVEISSAGVMAYSSEVTNLNYDLI